MGIFQTLHQGTVAGLSIALCVMGLISCERQKRWEYPHLEPKTETVIRCGEAGTEDYSALERLEDSQVQNWFSAQDSLTASYWTGNTELPKLLEHFSELDGREGERVMQVKRTETGRYFYLKAAEGEEAHMVYAKKGPTGSPELVFDPNGIFGESSALTYLEPSYTGKYVALGVQGSGRFDSDLYILDTGTGELLSETLKHINPEFGGVEWLPDESGFLYLHFPVVDKEKPAYKKNSYTAWHQIGRPQERDVPIFGKGQGLEAPDNFFPKVKLGSSSDKYLIGYLANAGNFYEAFAADLQKGMSENLEWRPFFKASDSIFYNQGELRGNEFIFRQATATGNRLCRVEMTAPDFTDPEVLAKGSVESPITKFEVTRSDIYYIRERFGVEVSVHQITKEQWTKELKLPFNAGYADFFGETLGSDRLGIIMDGWTANTTRYELDGESQFMDLALERSASYPEFKGLISKQVMVVSHDGTEVPLSLVHHKDMPLDGDNPVFVYVYGAYGDSMSPFFYPIFLDWAAQGGILAFPHVRGGGEKGPEWHREGSKNLKHNSWMDTNACMQYLIDKGYSRKGGIALYTNSAGGITAGMAVEEAPELYGALILEVPRMHPYGLESSKTASSTSYLEYGSINDPLECTGLLAMDPYLNLSGDSDYPPTLVFTSFNDDRIPLWDNGKYVARRQSFPGAASAPVLMEIQGSGHEQFIGYDETLILNSKIFAFARTYLK